jgi:hypothetical protein
MIIIMLFSLLIFLSLFVFNDSCEYLQIQNHPQYEGVIFSQIPLNSDLLRDLQETGRPSYIFTDHKDHSSLYLFHVSDSVTGEGRWILSKDLRHTPSDESILGYIRSWSPVPYFYQRDSLSPSWYFVNSGNDQSFEIFPEFLFECHNCEDKTIFINMRSTTLPRIDGYYVERFRSSSSSLSPVENKEEIVYSQIKFKESDKQLYLFRFETTSDFSAKWLIGFEYGVDSAYAFCEDFSYEAVAINNPWHILDGYEWRKDDSIEILSSFKFSHLSIDDNLVMFLNEGLYGNSKYLCDYLQYFRSIVSYNNPTDESKTYSLRNGNRLPVIGLGTGGIILEESSSVFTDAIALGYRLFDSAREYGNEFIIGNLMKELSHRYHRNHFFLETKVWPTQLGFLPTTNSIITSLNDFQTSYIDLYLIHWPE